MKKLIFCLLALVFVQNIFSQSLYTKQKTLNSIFTRLVSSYGSNKSSPELKLIPKNPLNIPAIYESSPTPIIRFDEKLFDICINIGSDSTNALAAILSHELAHYYKDHSWCSDYAFAIRKSNKYFAQKLNSASKDSKIEKESIADKDGVFYACVAGYTPFEIYGKILDKIYYSYKLPEKLDGYPTKQQRKNIAKDAETKAKYLYNYFKIGIKALEQNKFDEAIAALTESNSYIPFRETYNNLGVARTRKALTLKVKTSEEINFPDRFLYPLEVENKSRLNQEDTRGLDDEKNEEMLRLLNEAKKDFEKAINIDPLFYKGFVNLACVYDLIGNPNKAIGIIKEMPKEQQNKIESQRILAIAYYHNEQENIANTIWKDLGL